MKQITVGIGLGFEVYYFNEHSYKKKYRKTELKERNPRDRIGFV